jgi:hypothetical protein
MENGSAYLIGGRSVNPLVLLPCYSNAFLYLKDMSEVSNRIEFAARWAPKSIAGTLNHLTLFYCVPSVSFSYAYPLQQKQGMQNPPPDHLR